MADHRSGNRFAAEAYEAGNANMEYDAALDAMHIDPGHENALGMEARQAQNDISESTSVPETNLGFHGFASSRWFLM